MTATRIYTYDSTLRDGEQCEGITLSLADKLAIVRRLDEFGIDYIEGGFPASNPKDVAFFREVAALDLKHAPIAAFGSTCKKGVAAADDPGLADLIACGAPVVTIVGKTWDAQVERALQTTLEENLRMIGESVAHLKAAGRHVVFDAEHYFDGFKANRDYALACVGAAVDAGADSVDLCETNGGALPFEVEQIVAATVAAFPNQAFGIHCHNDSGCAVANTLAAVRAGATSVQGTVNGIGERVGNTDLLTVIADLELKMGARCVGGHSLTQLTSVAQYVADELGLTLQVENMSFNNLLTSLDKVDFDMVLSAMEATPDRLENADFSTGYYSDTPPAILVKADKADQYKTLADFNGKAMGAQAATTKLDMVNDIEGVNAVSLESVLDLVNELVYDKVDAILVDGGVAQQYADANPDLVICSASSELPTAEPYCIAVAKGDPKGLLDGINAALAKMASENKIESFIADADALASVAVEVSAD